MGFSKAGLTCGARFLCDKKNNQQTSFLLLKYLKTSTHRKKTCPLLLLLGFKQNIDCGLSSLYHPAGTSAARPYIMNTQYFRHLITKQEASLYHRILYWCMMPVKLLETSLIFITLCLKGDVSVNAEVDSSASSEILATQNRT